MATQRGVKKASDKTKWLQRRQLIVEHHLRGDTHYTVAQRFGISIGRVSQIVRDARLEWQAQRIADFSLFAGEELERIKRLENAAHLAFIKSCLPKIRLIEPKDRKMSKAEKAAWYKAAAEEKAAKLKELKALPLNELILRDESQGGEIKLLDTVLKCIDRRIKLLGLDAPDKIALEGTDGKPINITVDPKKELDKFNRLPAPDRIKFVLDKLAGRN